MVLKDIVIQYRREHGLSQRAFAARCGVSNGFVSTLESGVNPGTKKPITPTFRNIQSLAEGMGITARALMDMADDLTFTILEDDAIPELEFVNDAGKRLAREFVRMLSKLDEFKK